MKKLMIFVGALALCTSVFAGGPFSFYGFVRAEAIYDDTQVVKGDWLLYAPSGAGGDADETQAFTMTGRHSRVGVKIDGGTDDKGRTVKGLIEADFAGGFPNSSTAARQPNSRLRHAWVEWAQPDVWAFRVGQDWALISGPFPGTTSFVVGAGKGHLWMRYPQAKVTLKAGPAKLAVSANRPMAGNVKYDEYAGGDFDIVGDGEITGRPWFMGRTWLKFGNVGVSVSGHYGQESIADDSGDRHDVDSWSFNADCSAKFGPAAVYGRFFTGENLNSFFGGVFQGFTKDATSVTSLPATGGWGQVKYAVNDKVAATVGGGVDQADTENLAPTNRESNTWVFANVAYKVNKQLSYTVEWEQLTTAFVGPDVDDGVANRIHFVALFKF